MSEHSNQSEGRHDELLKTFLPRFKGGLETPIHIHIYGENKRVTFAPPLWYDGLTYLCIFGGFGMAILAIFRGGFQIGMFPFLGFFLWIAVGLAGTWARYSTERMSCDPRKGTYARLEGLGVGKRLTRGQLQELDAIVLMTEKHLLMSLVGETMVTYRLVLHWKGSRLPLLVIDQRKKSLPSSAPLNQGAGELYHLGMRVAKLLGVPFYDNSYYPSPCPVHI